MSMETRDLVANLREAIRLVEAQPDNQLQLNVFRADSVCGTVACTAGLCAMSTYFRERGMRAHGRGWTVIYGAPYMMQSGPLGPVKLDEFATLNHFFGTYPGDVKGQRFDAYSVLFAPRGRGRWDEALYALYRDTAEAGPYAEPTDKQLALMRLNRALMLRIAASAASTPVRAAPAPSAWLRIARRVGLARSDRSDRNETV